MFAQLKRNPKSRQRRSAASGCGQSDCWSEEQQLVQPGDRLTRLLRVCGCGNHIETFAMTAFFPVNENLSETMKRKNGTEQKKD